jgi:hypothetical protein
MPPASSLPLDELTRRLGALRWAELRWAETLGTWMRDETDPAVKVALGTSCQRREAHAALLAERLPTYRPAPTGGADDIGVTPESATGPGDDGARLFGAAVAGAGDTASRLAALYRVGLSRLLVEYGTLLAAIDARVDGPTNRALTSMAADDAAELAAAGGLLRRFGVSDG